MFNDFENITQCSIFRQGDKISHHSHQNTSFTNNGVFPKWLSKNWLNSVNHENSPNVALLPDIYSMSNKRYIPMCSNKNSFYHYLWEQGIREKSGERNFLQVRELSGNFVKCQGILTIWLVSGKCQGNFNRLKCSNLVKGIYSVIVVGK